MSKELKIENQLDSNLRQVKVGETASPIEIATDKIRISGDLLLSNDLTIGGNLLFSTPLPKFEMAAGVVLDSTEVDGQVSLAANTFSVGSAIYNNDTKGIVAVMGGSDNDAQLQLWNGGVIEWTIANDAEDAKLKFDANTVITGGATKLTLADDGDLTTVGDVSIASAKKLYLDGGGDTYIVEASADVVRYYVGNELMMIMIENGADGNQTNFVDSSVGFTQLEPTYDATATVVDFRFSNKQNLTFGAGNITNINLYFPAMSGNFQLLVKQDGTGSRTIANYKVYESDESVADGEAAVKWAGGSNPTFTTDANHVDILSFYWDADNEIAYGVATLDFQF